MSTSEIFTVLCKHPNYIFTQLVFDTTKHNHVYMGFNLKDISENGPSCVQKVKPYENSAIDLLHTIHEWCTLIELWLISNEYL